ncbi:unnamed protein product [Phytomonas sp. EM1]|nr:unnamed protein product [Phytomonas sp. EM1]|eukprot:CCW64891.1 unnamed protein product [Phytomonas sp. isolate EM1]
MRTKCRKALLLNRNRCDSVPSVAITPTRASTASEDAFFTPMSTKMTSRNTSDGKKSSRSSNIQSEERASPSTSPSPFRSRKNTAPIPGSILVESTFKKGESTASTPGPSTHADDAPPTRRAFLNRWRVSWRRPAVAFLSGEPLLKPTPRPSLLAQRFRTNRLDQIYAQTDITSSELDALYSRPAFTRWYETHREELLDEVAQRQRAKRWAGVCAFGILLLGLFALPAFGFSNTTWGGTLAVGTALTEAETFLQLVGRRAQLLSRGVTDATSCRLWKGPFQSKGAWEGSAWPPLRVRQWICKVEQLLLVAAVLGLLTSAFMGRGSRSKVVVALGCFLILLFECALVPGVRIRLGMGFSVVSGFVAVTVAQSLS